MTKHPYRALLIWAAIVVALVNIYPTIGWMTLSEEARTERLQRWAEEDQEFHREKRGFVDTTMYSFQRWLAFDREKVINLGLDLQGGIHMILGFDIENLEEEKLAQYREDGYDDDQIREEVQQVVLQQIRRRVDEFEAKEPVIQALGGDKIQVLLPGEKDIQRAKNLITKVAQLNFHIVSGLDETVEVFQAIKDEFPGIVDYLERNTTTSALFRINAGDEVAVSSILNEARERGGIIPDDKIIRLSRKPKPYESQEYGVYVLDKEPLASGEGLTSARAMPDQMNPPYWQILFGMSNESAAEFGEGTGAHIGDPMAIVVDNVVVSAPTIQDRISSRGTITGRFEGEEARDLAIALSSGSMVVPVREEYTGVVGPALGAVSIQKGVTSALAGIAIVGVFMIIYYLKAGVIAVIGLALNAIFVIAAMAYFGMTLTLPGIAGLILTVGMAVDANVLIFERIREELRLGHSVISSVDSGFKRASVAILDANVTTLIAAAVLFQFGTGPIEGFAITLSVGVLSSVFVALVITRAIFDFLVGRDLLKSLPMLSIVSPDTKVPFMSYQRYAGVASAVVIIAGMGLFISRGSDNLGVDFRQGTNAKITLATEADVTAESVRIALADAGFEGANVQKAGEGGALDENHFIILVGDVLSEEAASNEAAPADGEERPATALVGETVSDRLQNALAGLTDSGTIEGVQLDEVQTVGPAVGEKLRSDAVNAVLFAFLFIVAYIIFRFEWRFALGAMVALIHDVLITLGAFAVTDRPISLPVIAAVLTIIGYSLNDTIVIFDRIREDLRLYRGKGYKLLDILNIAINATLSRTILTSLTTLFVVVVLYFFGGLAINDFAFALIVGIVAGTYSTVFIATPVFYLCRKRKGGHLLPTDSKSASGDGDDDDESGARKKRKKTGGAKSKTKSKARGVA